MKQDASCRDEKTLIFIVASQNWCASKLKKSELRSILSRIQQEPFQANCPSEKMIKLDTPALKHA
jgi:hypothetical protein